MAISAGYTLGLESVEVEVAFEHREEAFDVTTFTLALAEGFEPVKSDEELLARFAPAQTPSDRLCATRLTAFGLRVSSGQDYRGDLQDPGQTHVSEEKGENLCARNS